MDAFASATRQTVKKKISLLLIANANGQGDTRLWSHRVRRHLEDIDQSDPDIAYSYATYLARRGPGRAASVIRWSEVALENRTRWTGETRSIRVYGLFKLRAAGANTLWLLALDDYEELGDAHALDRVAKTRDRLETYAREWYRFAVEAGKDPTTPLQLCVSASGSQDWCEGAP